MTPRVRLAGLVEALGQAKVGDLGGPIGREQHVGRLQVAMDHLGLMRRVHGAGQDSTSSAAARPSGVPVQLAVEAAAGAKLQGEEGRALVLADLVDLHDVGVLQAGDGLGLDAEAVVLGRAWHVATCRIILRATRRFRPTCRAL